RQPPQWLAPKKFVMRQAALTETRDRPPQLDLGPSLRQYPTPVLMPPGRSAWLMPKIAVLLLLSACAEFHHPPSLPVDSSLVRAFKAEVCDGPISDLHDRWLGYE